VSPLGAGTLTEVWRAVRISEGRNGPHYAVKRVLDQLDRETEFTASFKTLATAAMALQHHGVVRTLDAGTEAARDMTTLGRTYVAQELVAGKPLNALLNQLRTTTKEVPRALTFTVIGHTLQALAYAHRATGAGGAPLQIIHGDVAPANVFVTLDGTVKVSDFCINRARMVLRHAANAGLRARFHYLAPETARTGHADLRADLYAVGVMLHEMLSFRRLRRGNTSDEVLAQAQSGVWPALDTLGVSSDADLNAILSRALNDDPNQRFQSADEFLAAVGGYAQSRELVMAAPDLSALMSAHFPQLSSAETEGRAQVSGIYNTLQGIHTTAPLGEQPHDALAREDGAASSPRRAPVTRGKRSSKLLYTLLGSLIVVAAVATTAFSLLTDRETSEDAPVKTRAPRDLTRLVGGRTVTYWQDRVTTLDQAISEATKRPGGESSPETQQLKALREDTVRKGQALGLTGLGQR